MTGYRPFIHLALAVAAAMPLTVAATPGHADHPELTSLIERLADRDGHSGDVLRKWLNEAEIRPEIVEAIEEPAEALPWHRYREIFLTEERIEDGVAFWNDHESTLARAEAQFGVPAAVITAIIGVETAYGRHTGRHRAIDALVTLGLEHPPRAEFFLSELEEFLTLAVEEDLDPLAIKGSYAGAMGIPQFIASSYRNFAVDFSDSGQRDLLNDPEDAIGSVANYLAEHDWAPGGRVAVPLRHTGALPLRFLAEDPQPRHAVADLMRAGLVPATPLPEDTPVAVIALERTDGREYWAGLQNFYAITRYNHSPLYAMAVHQLAEAIEARRDR